MHTTTHVVCSEDAVHLVSRSASAVSDHLQSISVRAVVEEEELEDVAAVRMHTRSHTEPLFAGRFCTVLHCEVVR